MERVLVAFANAQAQERICRLLESGGSIPAGCFFTGAEVIRAARKLGTAIVVCGFKLRDMTANTLAANLRGIGAVLVVSAPSHLTFCEGENLFKLSSPASRADFFASLELLSRLETQSLRPPVVRQRASDQKLVSRAKALLMDVGCMSENEAHRFLQKKSMDSGLRLAETAQLVIDSYTP